MSVISFTNAWTYVGRRPGGTEGQTVLAKPFHRFNEMRLLQHFGVILSEYTGVLLVRDGRFAHCQRNGVEVTRLLKGLSAPSGRFFSFSHVRSAYHQALV